VEETPEEAEKLAALILWLVHDGLPLSTVESTYFRGFMHLYNAQAFSRRLLTDTLPAIREALTARIQHLLSQASSVAGTSDSWTDARLRKFVSLTLHFVDDDWNLQSLCVDVFSLLESHTGPLLAAAIKKKVDKWVGDEQLFSAHVTDNGANFANASEEIVGVDNHIPCFAHTLQLAIGDVLGKDGVSSKCKSDIQKVQQIVDAVQNHCAPRLAFQKHQLPE